MNKGSASPNMTKAKMPKSPRRRWLIARRIVQMVFLLLFPLPLILAGYMVANSGVDTVAQWSLLGGSMGDQFKVLTPAEVGFYGSLSSSELFGLELLDPFAVLQVIAASKTLSLNWLIFVLPIFLFYLVIRGRAFCGWVCPANLVLEFTDWLRRILRIKVKERTIPRHTKIFVALGVFVLSAIISIPVFEMFTPISAINKFILFGSTAGMLTLLAIIITELFWSHRVWCRALCPLGGFYEAIGRVGLFNVRIDQSVCTHCDRCKDKCLAAPEILDPALEDKQAAVLAGDCMLCGECVDVCPTKALKIRPGLDHFKPHKAAKNPKN